MRCLYLACPRRAGFRKYCKAHRIWVDYIRLRKSKGWA